MDQTHVLQDFLKTINDGRLTDIENQEVHQWNITDQALTTLINSTLATVLRQTTSPGVWNALESRFTSLSRIHTYFESQTELHNIKKGTNTIDSYSQCIKSV